MFSLDSFTFHVHCIMQFYVKLKQYSNNTHLMASFQANQNKTTVERYKIFLSFNEAETMGRQLHHLDYMQIICI